jgi:ParB/RepB/Spo0J family partition protein
VSLVLDLPIAQLATTLAPLRGPRTDPASRLAPLPLRATPAADGTYEVLDGFKRLAHWTGAGHTHVPVVVEDAPGVRGKARLLEANAPRRTLSAMDEARVVRSLADDDHLSSSRITALLGRSRGWVDRRLVLGRRLVPEVARRVDTGRLSATTAHALAALPRSEQPTLAATLERHGLRTREAEAFVATWRAAADDPVTREALLRNPRHGTPPTGDATVSPLGPTARELQARFAQTERALADLVHVDLTGFADPDRRVPGGLPPAPRRPDPPQHRHSPG